jgi:hypothetical protein
MYYPEANVLVPTTADSRSRTPAFKCVLVQLEPESIGGADPARQVGHSLPVLSLPAD